MPLHLGVEDAALASLSDMPATAIASMLDAISDMVGICVDGYIRHLNASGLRVFGVDDVSALQTKPFQGFISDDFATTIDDVVCVLADEQDAMPIRLKNMKGETVSLRLIVKTLVGFGEKAHLIVGENVTRQAELIEAIQQSEARYRRLVNHALDLICVMDDGKINYINAAGLKMLKAPSAEHVVGRHIAEFMHKNYQDIFRGDIRDLIDDELLPIHLVDFEGGVFDAELAISMLDMVHGKKFMIEARDITAHNGAVRALRQSIETLEMRVEERTRELQEEVMERRRAEEKLRHVASHDGLTDLPNRSLLMDRLRISLASALRCDDKCAVLFIDLDGFKPINDTLGHDKGDVVLKETAGRLLSCVRESDTAARFGGDEFVIVLNNLDHERDAELVARKVLKTISKPIELDGDLAHIGCSIGIALFPDHGDTVEDVLKRADDAMYQVKENGKNNYALAPPI